jgi:hypoxanthine phosphoribosyltransferase
MERVEMLYTTEEVMEQVERLASEIREAYKDEIPTVISVLKGSFMFTADLVRRLPGTFSVDFIRAASYGDGTETSCHVSISLWPTVKVAGKKVLLVDDIADSGLTLNCLVERLEKEGAFQVDVCVLLDKPGRRKVEFTPRFVGFTIPNLFVVGYGIDYAEKYRNLPYIGVLKEG